MKNRARIVVIKLAVRVSEDFLEIDWRMLECSSRPVRRVEINILELVRNGCELFGRNTVNREGTGKNFIVGDKSPLNKCDRVISEKSERTISGDQSTNNGFFDSDFSVSNSGDFIDERIEGDGGTECIENSSDDLGNGSTFCGKPRCWNPASLVVSKYFSVRGHQ